MYIVHGEDLPAESLISVNHGYPWSIDFKCKLLEVNDRYLLHCALCKQHDDILQTHALQFGM